MWLTNKKNLPLILVAVVLILGAGLITIFSPQVNSYRLEKYRQDGINYASLGDYENAKKSFNKVLELDPQDYSAYYWLGVSYFMENDTENAGKYFFEALELEAPESVKAQLYSELSSVFLFEGDYDKALEYSEQVLSQEIDSETKESQIKGEAYSNMGRIYMLLGNFEKSLEYFNKSLEVDIEDPVQSSNIKGNSYVGLASYYFTFGDFKKSEEHLLKGLEINSDLPTIFRIYLGLGKTYFSLKDYQKAIVYLKEGLDAIQGFNQTEIGLSFVKFQLYQELGKCYLNLENCLKAREYFNKILEIKDDIKHNTVYEQAFAETVANLGFGDCHLAEGNYNKALESFEIALISISSVEPKFSNEEKNVSFFSIMLHYKLSLANYGKGNILEAKEEINKASNLIDSLSGEDYFIPEKVQWFKDTDSLFQKVSSLKTELEG